MDSPSAGFSLSSDLMVYENNHTKLRSETVMFEFRISPKRFSSLCVFCYITEVSKQRGLDEELKYWMRN